MKTNELQLDDTSRQKSKIRERYKGVDPDELDVIPAIPQEDIFKPSSIKRVAVYARVSTDDPRQTSSYELQKNHYTDMVSRRPDWKLEEIYADEGISGTSLQHRDAFIKMIEDCKAGKIDLIVTKSVSRFARNVLDCIGYVRQLKAMNPPIGVFFETENIYTLNSNSEMSLSFISTLAQEESHTKSEIMNASIEMRFKRGIFLTPVLLGYDQDEDGNLVINEEEAKIVRLIFFMYLYGYSLTEIANTLTKAGCRSKRGNTIWSPGTVRTILQNERHCGDVLARKTWTPNYLDHKSKKNRQDRNQYRMKDHHESIISRDDFIAVQRMLANSRYGNRDFLPALHVINEGLLAGYVLIHPRWAGFKKEDYISASNTVIELDKPPDIEIQAYKGDFDFRGYELVRSSFFPGRETISMTISVNAIQFSAHAIMKFKDTRYIEMFVHPQKRKIAVRPSRKNERNSVEWSYHRDEKLISKKISAAAFAMTLFDLFGWDRDCKYKATGIFKESGEEKAIIFDLNEASVVFGLKKTPHDSTDEFVPLARESISNNIIGCPPSWAQNFGDPYYKAQNDVIEEDKMGISSSSEIYGETDLKVTDRETIHSTIQDLISNIGKEDKDHE